MHPELPLVVIFIAHISYTRNSSVRAVRNFQGDRQFSPYEISLRFHLAARAFLCKCDAGLLLSNFSPLAQFVQYIYCFDYIARLVCARPCHLFQKKFCLDTARDERHSDKVSQ